LVRGAGKGAKPEPSAKNASAGEGLGASPPQKKKFEKLVAISCNLAYIFGTRMALDIIQNWAFAEQKKL